MKNKRMLGNVLLLFTAMIWGTAFVFQRVGMDSIEPATFNAARMALAAVAVGIVSFLMRGRNRTSGIKTEENKRFRRDTFIGGICCGCFLALGSIFQQMGLVHTTAGKAGFITAMYMLLVPVISFVFLKKRYHVIVWIAVVMGIVGMYFLCISEKFSFDYGDVLVMVCALFFCFHILCCDHFVKRGDPVAISAIQFAVTAVISYIFAVFTEEPGIDKVISAIVPILYCGIVSGGIGYTLQIVAQRFTEPAIASLLMSMESVFAVIAGTLILDERMSVRELVGCIIMFLAIIIVQIPEKKKK